MNLVYKNENLLFGVMLAVSMLAWGALLIGTLGQALLYAAAFYLAWYLACYVAQSALVAWLTGTGVRITAQQFPDLHQRVLACCARLERTSVPEAYLLQAGGGFHALARRFPGNNIIVLDSDLVDALDDRPDAINFHIGHAIGRLDRRHLHRAALLAPAALLPLLGAAYARAREYSCDRHGFHACAELASAQAGLAALAAGGKRWRHLDRTGYAAQARQAGGFWMSFHELISDRPWLVKRMAVVRDLAQGAPVEPAAPRHGLAYVLALCVPRVSLGLGAPGAALTLLTLAAVLATVAWPAWQNLEARTRMTQAVAVGREAAAVVERYYYAYGQSPATLEQAGYAMIDPGHVVQTLEVDAGNGVVRVHPSDMRYRGGALAFTPRVDENRRVLWRCSGEDLPAAVLPPDCRD